MNTIKIVFLCALAAASAVASGYDKPAPYAFGYETADHYGSHSRQESGDSYGNKRGSYSLTGADGRVRRVNYVADDYGFRAEVKTNEPGTNGKDSADAIVNAPDGYGYGSAQKTVVHAAPSYGARTYAAAPAHGYAAQSYGHSRSYGYSAPSYGYSRSYGYSAPAYGNGYGARGYGHATRSYGYAAPSYGYSRSYGYSAPAYGNGYGSNYGHSRSYNYAAPSYGYGARSYGYARRH